MRGRSSDLLTEIAPAIWGRTSIVTTEFSPNFCPDRISLAGLALIGGPTDLHSFLRCLETGVLGGVSWSRLCEQIFPRR